MAPQLPASLISLELLADKAWQPSALLWGTGPGDLQPLEAIAAFAGHEEFTSLAGRLPCLVPAAVLAPADPAIAEALLGAGCQPVTAEKILRSDRPQIPQLPLGADWIAGPWYLTAAPAQASGSQAASRALALQLVELVAQDADTRDIEELLRRDATLSYHLMRVVNSLGTGGNREITSFAQAILILGRQQLRRWLNLMLFSARAGDQRSAMLAARVAVRARSMELLAQASGMDRADQEQAFMAGMFSLLGVLFGMPLMQVLQPLQLSRVLRDAVLGQTGPLGLLLEAVVLGERGDLAMLTRALAEAQVSAADYNLLLLQAHNWMLTFTRESGGHG
jgi:HDOD domain